MKNISKHFLIKFHDLISNYKIIKKDEKRRIKLEKLENERLEKIELRKKKKRRRKIKTKTKRTVT